MNKNFILLSILSITAFQPSTQAAGALRRAKDLALLGSSAAYGWLLGQAPLPSLPSNNYTEHPELTAFLERYPVPKSFKPAIERCSTDETIKAALAEQISIPDHPSSNPVYLDDLGFYIKPGNIDRALNQRRLASFIKDQGFEKYLGTAEKYLAWINKKWHIIAREVPKLEGGLETPSDVQLRYLNNEWVPWHLALIKQNDAGKWEAKGIDTDGTLISLEEFFIKNPIPKHKKLSLAAVQALFTAMEKIGMCDMKGENFKWSHDNILTAIDTENRSFTASAEKIQSHTGALMVFLGDSMEPEAQAWLAKKFTTLPAATTEWDQEKPLAPAFKAYGDRDIDFDAVEQQFKDLVAAQNYQDDYLFKVLDPWK